MPPFFKEWLEKLTPQQAYDMWLYIDSYAPGDTEPDVFDILVPIALQDPAIRAREECSG